MAGQRASVQCSTVKPCQPLSRSLRGSRPDFLSASRKTNSICAFRLRKSSFAQRCMADKVFSSIRNANALRLAMRFPTCSGLTVKRAGINDGLRLFFSAKHDQQVTDHCRLAFFVELNNVALL
jgi:hypothetical protein